MRIALRIAATALAMAGDMSHASRLDIDLDETFFLTDEHSAARSRFAPAAVCIVRLADQVLLGANEPFLALIEFTREQAIGQAWATLVELRNMRGLDELAQTFEQRAAVADVELSFLSSSGAERIASATLAPLLADGSRCALVIAREITQRKHDERALLAARDELAQRVIQSAAELAQTVATLQAEIAERQQAERKLEEMNDRLHVLAAHLQNMREDERKRIAREIHDELGQELAALKMDLTLLRRKTERQPDICGPEIAVELSATGELVDRAIQTLRGICLELRPDVLDKLGLSEAMRWQAAEYRKHSGIACELQFNAQNLALSEAQATALFRIFQEALTNVAKHANADKVLAKLSVEDGILSLTVSDNGRVSGHKGLAGKPLIATTRP